MEKELQEKEQVDKIAENEIDSIQQYFAGINTGEKFSTVLILLNVHFTVDSLVTHQNIY